KPSEGSRGNSRVAPRTDSPAGAPIAPASPSPERGERSPSQEWQQQLASSWFSPSGWNERQLCGVGLFQGNSAIWLRRQYQGSCRLALKLGPKCEARKTSAKSSMKRPESHRCERIASAATTHAAIRSRDLLPRSSSVRPHACGVILLLSLASPRTGGPHACHYRTAGRDSRARRCGGGAAPRTGPASDGCG